MTDEEDLQMLISCVNNIADYGNQAPRRAVLKLMDDVKWARGQAGIQRGANLALKERISHLEAQVASQTKPNI